MDLIMSVNKYIVEDMNESAFKYCRKILFPILGFKVLKEREVRKKDLEERVLELQDKWLKEIGQQNGTYFFFREMELIFNDFLSTTKDSRADNYKNRALKAIEEGKNLAKKEDCTKDEIQWCIEHIEDIIMIATSLIRTIIQDNDNKWPKGDKNTTIDVNDAFTVYETDNIYLQKFMLNDPIPTDNKKRTRTKYVKQLNNISNLFLGDYFKAVIEKYETPTEVITAGKNYIYMIVILWLTYMLQTNGVFEEKKT